MRIITALREEFHSSTYEGITHYSGVGKVNAAITATEIILTHRPKLLINLGTCGALRSDLKGLYECGIFYDRDLEGEFNPGRLVNNSEKSTCSTGDTFLTKAPQGVKIIDVEPDFVDMEAFAIATVCRKYNVKFLCYKFVTDYINKESSIDWKDNIGKGNSLFRNKIDDYFSNAV